MAEAITEQPPFFVQAYRPAESDWITDCKRTTLPLAVKAAKKLRKQWSRTVRVIDNTERVAFQLGTTQRARGKR